MTPAETALDEQLEAALRAATDESARYHIRQALQIQIAEQEVREAGARTEI
jgi:hypothetical protein